MTHILIAASAWLHTLATIMFVGHYLLLALLYLPALFKAGNIVALSETSKRSRWWMKRFQYGPAEWLWRSLTYLKPQPMRRNGVSE